MNRSGLFVIGLYMMANFIGYLSIGSGLSLIISKRVRHTVETSWCMGLVLTLAGMLIVFGTHLIIKQIGAD